MSGTRTGSFVFGAFVSLLRNVRGSRIKLFCSRAVAVDPVKPRVAGRADDVGDDTAFACTCGVAASCTFLDESKKYQHFWPSKRYHQRPFMDWPGFSMHSSPLSAGAHARIVMAAARKMMETAGANEMT